MKKQIPRVRQQEPLPAKATPGSAPAAPGSSTDSPPPSGQHPAFGAMKGLLTVAPDLDLTAPAAPEWGQP